MADFSETGSVESDGASFCDWNSVDEDIPVHSLIQPAGSSAATHRDAASAWAELKAATGFDALELQKTRGLDGYAMVRIVNYIRGVTSTAASLGSVVAEALRAATTETALSADAAVWSDEKYLVPVQPDDSLIMAVLTAADDEEDDEDAAAVDEEEARAAIWRAAAGGAAAALDAGAAASASSTSSAAAAGGGSSESSAAAGAPPTSSGSAEAEISRLQKELSQARALLARLVAGGAGRGRSDSDSSSASSHSSGSSDSASSSAGAPAASTAATSATAAAVQQPHGLKLSAADVHASARGQDNHSYYFDSYAGAGIHQTMLRDRVRTEAYRDAIQGNSAPWIKGKTVLDLGCGTGILSMFSADAGAERVVALDASAVIGDAAAIIAANGKAGVITCVKGMAEQVPLDLAARLGKQGLLAPISAADGEKSQGTVWTADGIRRAAAAAAAAAAEAGTATTAGNGNGGDDRRVFDVIVSEWMGYALLYEAMLSSVLTIRDAYLKPGGRMLPSTADIRLGAVCDPSLWHDRVGWWSDVYGYSMAGMSRHAFPEAHVEVLPGTAIGSRAPHALLSRLCMATMTHADQDIAGAPFEITVDGSPAEETAAATAAAAAGAGGAVPSPSVLVHGLALWFDIDFGAETYPGPKEAAQAALQDACVEEKKGVSVSAAADGPPALEAAPAGGDEDDLPPLEENVPSSGAAEAVTLAPAVEATPAPGYKHVTFTTSPHATPTHWQQTLLLFTTPIAVPRGKTLVGKLSMVRDPVNPREYRFAAEVTVPQLTAAEAAAVGSEALAQGGGAQTARIHRQQWHMQ